MSAPLPDAGPEPEAPAAGSPRGRALRFALLALFVGVVVAFFVLGGQRYLTLDAVKANRDALLAFTQQHFATSLVVAFAVYAGATAFSLPGGLLLSLTMASSSAAGSARAGRRRRHRRGDPGVPRGALRLRRRRAPAARRMGLSASNAGFTENAFSYLLFLRLVPVFPFFLVNLAPAFTSIPLRTYVAATLVGIIPGTFVFVNLGQTLGRIESLSGLVSTETLGAFALLGLFALVPVLLKQLRSHRKNTDEKRERECVVQVRGATTNVHRSARLLCSRLCRPRGMPGQFTAVHDPR